jgi:hypothetical protein
MMPTSWPIVRVPDVNESVCDRLTARGQDVAAPATFTSAFSRLASAILTTQLYFPGEKTNAWDGLFERALLMHTAADAALLIATFNFVLLV